MEAEHRNAPERTGTHLTAAAISPDGNLLATGDYHGDVKLWRMKELFGG